MTGASGSPYGLRLVKALVECGETVAFVISDHARIVLQEEMGMELPDILPGVTLMGYHDIAAPIASGSFQTHGMIICPTSMSTLGEIAAGISRNLITRAADVTMKEGRKLLLVPREMPFTAIHLENMLKLVRLGVTIMPAAPGFYHRPESVDDLVNFVVGKILDHFQISHNLCKRWGQTP